MAAPRSTAKNVAILALPGVQLLDVAGPLDVFAEANVQAGKPVYRLHVVASRPGAISSSSGTRLMPDFIIPDFNVGAIDTLLVAGCPNAAESRPEVGVTDWLRATAPRTRRYGSVCTGAFYLAAAGLLNKRRVTTHWAVAAQLAQAYPAAIVDEDALYIRDGKLRTAAGVTAGLDLALALIEEDLGRDVAMKVAGQLVMFFKRPGGQMQFSRKGESLPAGRSILQEVQRFVAANPAAQHSVASLVARANLSARHFARLFHGEVGVTPAAWVESARVSAARRLLEDGRETPKQVAANCGFANADTLRRAFVRHVGVMSADYRKRYARG
jgi:transcriptional regulator GlxA family with amidase domain